MTKSPPLFDVLSHTAVTRAQFKGAAVFGTSVARLSGRPDPRRSVTDERISLREQHAGGRSWRTGHAAFVAAFCECHLRGYGQTHPGAAEKHAKRA